MVILYLNIWIIICGRIILGYAAGLSLIACSRIIEEVSPIQYIGYFGVFTNFN